MSMLGRKDRLFFSFAFGGSFRRPDGRSFSRQPESIPNSRLEMNGTKFYWHLYIRHWFVSKVPANRTKNRAPKRSPGAIFKMGPRDDRLGRRPAWHSFEIWARKSTETNAFIKFLPVASYSSIIASKHACIESSFRGGSSSRVVVGSYSSKIDAASWTASSIFLGLYTCIPPTCNQ